MNLSNKIFLILVFAALLIGIGFAYLKTAKHEDTASDTQVKDLHIKPSNPQN